MKKSWQDINRLISLVGIKDIESSINILCDVDIVSHWKYSGCLENLVLSGKLDDEQKLRLLKAFVKNTKINYSFDCKKVMGILGPKDPVKIKELCNDLFKEFDNVASAIQVFMWGDVIPEVDEKICRGIADHGFVFILRENKYTAKFDALNKLPPVMRMRCLERAIKLPRDGNNFIKALEPDQLDKLLFSVISKHRETVQRIVDFHRKATATGELGWYSVGFNCHRCGPIKHVTQAIMRLESEEDVKALNSYWGTCPLCRSWIDKATMIEINWGKGTLL